MLGQFQINKKLTSKQTQQTQQQTFPSFPHNLHFFPTAKPNATYIFVLILANDELFEFCVSCVKFGGNMKVFVEFVLRLIFVDLKLSQNPYMPTTDAQFSVRENLEICHFILKKVLKWQISRFIPLCFPAKSFPLARIDSPKIIFKKLSPERKMNPLICLAPNSAQKCDF